MFILWLLMLRGTQVHTPVSMHAHIWEIEGEGSNAEIAFIEEIFTGFCSVAGALLGTVEVKMNKTQSLPRGSEGIDLVFCWPLHWLSSRSREAES